MIPIKVTTEYSLLKSLIKIDDLINYLNANNINACGICDDDLYGVLEFYIKCKNNNIKPLIGLEVPIENSLIYTYAKNYLGYQKLIEINLKIKNDSISIIDLNDENIINIIPFKYIKIKDKINNYYLGYENIDEKNYLLKITDKVLPIKNICTLKKEDLLYLKYLHMLKESSYEKEYSFIDIDDDKNVNEFTNLIDINIPFNNKYIPTYSKNSEKYLYDLAHKGLLKRLNNKKIDIYEKRLDEELNVIKNMGFIDYFLIVYDYVLYAKKNNILVGPGRGSAAGSLVSYSIGITNIDPIKYDLSFARFLNPYRKKMPDIDIDFEDTKRSDVINYVKNRYGNNHVAVGLTFNNYKAKLILRDLAKVLKIDNILLEKFIKNIDAKKNLKDNLENENVKKYLELYKELNNLYSIALHLEGLKKNESTHAAGVIIGSKNLSKIIPITENEIVNKTGVTMDYLESLGLLKMDFLALSNLRLIKNIINKIPCFSLEDIPLDDKKTYELFINANTDNIFQFESNYAKNNLLKLKPSNFDELVIAMALVRPGPSNQIDEYIKNKNGNIFIHEKLKSVLSSTCGVIIFQEQVMKILSLLAGYSEYEADNIRYAISKKKENIIVKEEQNFINNCIKNNIDKSFAIDIFNKIKKFAEYGFNKSHSVSYSIIAYDLAYLKVNYPVEFCLALLEETKDINKIKKYIDFLKSKNIKILKPNILLSSKNFIIKNNSLLLPFQMINKTNDNIINVILEKRNKNIKDIFSFLMSINNILNDEVYDMLVYSSLLDVFKVNKQTLIENKEIIFNFIDLNDINAKKPLLKDYPEYDDDILRDKEFEYYGMYLGNHPCSIYKNVIKVKDKEKYLFKNINMTLLIQKISRIKTKKGEDMAFIEASDETGTVELTIFPNIFDDIKDLKINDIINIIGKSSKRYDKYHIIVDKIKKVMK